MAGAPRLSKKRLEQAGIGAFFRPRDLEQLGITEPMLRTLVRRQVVERVARGLYRLATEEPTEHYTVAEACARNPRAIICLLTALRMHEIGPRQPPEVWLAIPHGTHPSRAHSTSVRTIRFSGVFLTAGVEPIRLDGVPAKITNPARTIIDCLRFRRSIDRETAYKAVREGMRSGLVTTNSLMKMARTCDVADQLRQEIELLS